MLDLIKTQLAKQNIELVSCLSLDECILTRPYLLEREGISGGSVIIFAVPYLARVDGERINVSCYAIARDYHLFFQELFNSLMPILKEKYPNNKFCAFVDHSPINEILAAAKCGLGIIGKNHLLITEKYSSFVFLGEIITDLAIPSETSSIVECEGCGLCAKHCPANMDKSKCLSAVTQKKGKLSDLELDAIKKHGCAWGCDLCQTVCPHTVKALQKGTIYSEIDFFKTELTPTLTSEQIENMSEEEFKNRAYSWRGKDVILRNLKHLEGKEI